MIGNYFSTSKPNTSSTNISSAVFWPCHAIMIPVEQLLSNVTTTHQKSLSSKAEQKKSE